VVGARKGWTYHTVVSGDLGGRGGSGAAGTIGAACKEPFVSGYIDYGECGIVGGRFPEGRVRFETLLAFFLMLPKTLFTLRPFMDFMVAASELAPQQAALGRRWAGVKEAGDEAGR
jgi:hypothetical protein